MVDSLSSREREVVRLTASGKSSKEIARSLGLSVKTIEKHRQSINRKTSCHNAAQLTLFAIREGIISPWQPLVCSGCGEIHD